MLAHATDAEQAGEERVPSQAPQSGTRVIRASDGRDRAVNERARKDGCESYPRRVHAALGDAWLALLRHTDVPKPEVDEFGCTVCLCWVAGDASTLGGPAMRGIRRRVPASGDRPCTCSRRRRRVAVRSLMYRLSGEELEEALQWAAATTPGVAMHERDVGPAVRMGKIPRVGRNDRPRRCGIRYRVHTQSR